MDAVVPVSSSMPSVGMETSIPLAKMALWAREMMKSVTAQILEAVSVHRVDSPAAVLLAQHLAHPMKRNAILGVAIC